MITKAQKAEGQTLVGEIAYYRAMGRCEMDCRRRATEMHHAFHGRGRRSIWQLCLNENFRIALCTEHHKTAPNAPHMNDDLFWDTIEKGLTHINPDRVAVLLYQKSVLDTQKFLSDRQCDGKAEIARLRTERDRWKFIYDYDQEVLF